MDIAPFPFLVFMSAPVGQHHRCAFADRARRHSRTYVHPKKTALELFLNLKVKLARGEVSRTGRGRRWWLDYRWGDGACASVRLGQADASRKSSILAKLWSKRHRQLCRVFVYSTRLMRHVCLIPTA
jgi:hypothetical protein